MSPEAVNNGADETGSAEELRWILFLVYLLRREATKGKMAEGGALVGGRRGEGNS